MEGPSWRQWFVNADEDVAVGEHRQVMIADDVECVFFRVEASLMISIVFKFGSAA